MKKIIFVCDSLRIGGIQRSLVSLLNEIDFKNYSVDLFLYNNDGDYKDFISPKVRIIQSNKITSILGMTSAEVKSYGYYSIIFRKFISVLCFLLGSNIIYKIIFAFESNLQGYDVAISFSNNVSSRSIYYGYNKFVLEKIKAKKKIAWVHVDAQKIPLNNKINLKEYEKFDAIINVSKATKHNFDSIFPQLIHKSFYIYNIIPDREIVEKALEFNPFKGENRFKIVTVCRLDKNKSVLKILKTASLLKEDNLEFLWTIVGDGPEFKFLANYIFENGLDDVVKLIGYKSNPYPYIYYSNLLVSASKSESFGLNIAEAIKMNTPVVATNYPALSEIIENKKNGVIVSRKEGDIFNVIKDLILDSNSYITLKKNTKLVNISNKQTMNYFYKLISEEGDRC